MTPREIAIIDAFENVTFPMATRQKRFAKDMIALRKHDPARELSARQHRYLTILAWRFRRQMPANLAYPDDDIDKVTVTAALPPAKRSRQTLSDADQKYLEWKAGRAMP
jgi:hypothetical protein